MGIIAEAWRAERRRDMGFVPISVGEHRLSFSSSLDALRIVVYRSYVGRGKGSSGIADDEVASIVHGSRHSISRGAPCWGAAHASRWAE